MRPLKSMFVLLLASAAIFIPSDRRAGASTPFNILYIVTDDQMVETMPHMRRLAQVFGTESVTFSEATVTSPLCCPSRASMLTGLFARHHPVKWNLVPHGGAPSFPPADAATIATWLQGAGYETGLFGKYLNGYDTTPTYLAPGWSEWRVVASSCASGGCYYNYTLNENATMVTYGTGAANYSTDVIWRHAESWIAARSAGVPWFAHVAFAAPHLPTTPAAVDLNTFKKHQPIYPTSFNEADMSDKPSWLRGLPLLSKSQATANIRKQLESLQAVDRAVDGLVQTVTQLGQLANTIIIYTSDNGVMWGRHRLPVMDKNAPYEESIRVPFFVRKAGLVSRTDPAPVQNIDLAPTIAEWAGVSLPVLDGVSFATRLEDPSVSWRTAAYHESFGYSPSSAPTIKWKGVRTASAEYVEYDSAEYELYDRLADPYQLQNQAGNPAYSGLLATMQALLAQFP